MTTLIHIVGQQGVGKSILAADIVAGLKARNKSALALVDAGIQIDYLTQTEADHIRRYFALEYGIAEHNEQPASGVVKTGELVITLQRAA